jgi:hypothetical protein
MNSGFLNSYFRSIGPEDDSFIESFVATSDFEGQFLNFTILVQIDNKIQEVASIAEEFVVLFKESFLKSDKKWFDRFEDAVFACNEYVLDVCEQTLLSRSDFNIVIAGCIDNKILFSKANNAEVYLLRNADLMHISEDLGDTESQELLFSSVASGELQPGDKFILCSQRLQRYVSTKKLLETLLPLKDDQILDELDSSLKLDLEKRLGILLIAVLDSKVNAAKLEKFTVLESFTKLLTGRGFLVDKIAKKNLYLLLVVLVLGLIFGTYFSFTRVVEHKKMAHYNTLLDEARLIVNSARSQSDKAKVAFTLETAENKLKTLESVKALSKQVINLKSDIGDLYAKVDNVQVFAEPGIILDLSQDYPAAEIVDFAVSEGGLQVVTGEFALEVLSSFAKQPFMFPAKFDFEASSFMSDSREFVLLNDKYELMSLGENQIDVLSAELDHLDSIKDMVAYGRRLYTLNPKAKQIYKYQRIRNSFANPKAYLSSENLELDKATALAIDGTIYVAFEDGSIMQFYQGKKNEFFKLESEPLTEVSQIDAMFTDFDHDYLYILESEKNRLVKFFKQNDGDLDYVSQYSFPDLNITKVFVDFNSSDVFLGSKDKIYKIRTGL